MQVPACGGTSLWGTSSASTRLAGCSGLKVHRCCPTTQISKHGFSPIATMHASAASHAGRCCIALLGSQRPTKLHAILPTMRMDPLLKLDPEEQTKERIKLCSSVQEMQQLFGDHQGTMSLENLVGLSVQLAYRVSAQAASSARISKGPSKRPGTSGASLWKARRLCVQLGQTAARFSQVSSVGRLLLVDRGCTVNQPLHHHQIAVLGGSARNIL